MAEEVTIEDLQKQIKATEEKVEAKLQTQVKASASKMKAALHAIFSAMTPNQASTIKAKLSATEDEDLKKAMEDIPDKKDATGDEEDKKETASLKATIDQLTATVKVYEDQRNSNMINDIVQVKASLVPGLDETAYRTQLGTLGIDTITQIHNDRKDEIEAVKASVAKDPEAKTFPRMVTGATQVSKMTSVKDILAKGGIA